MTTISGANKGYVKMKTQTKPELKREATISSL